MAELVTPSTSFRLSTNVEQVVKALRLGWAATVVGNRVGVSVTQRTPVRLPLTTVIVESHSHQSSFLDIL